MTLLVESEDTRYDALINLCVISTAPTIMDKLTLAKALLVYLNEYGSNYCTLLLEAIVNMKIMTLS